MPKSIRLRRPKKEDVSEIQRITKNWPLITSFRSAAIAEDQKGELIAFGITRHVVEFVAHVNNDSSPADRAVAISDLIKLAKIESQFDKVERIHVFAENEKFARFLMKHFGFYKAEGIPLILELEDGE